jgi:DNA-binding GntR family transcriptional regulator
MPVPKSDTAASRTLLRDQVTDRIRAAVLDGTLEPGERLHDDQLISWLGVSRTPIREALASLANEGLIEMAANRYTRVALPHPDAVLDALRTLGVLVGGVVRLTVPVMTEQQVATTVKRLDGEVERLRDGGTARIVLTVGGAYDSWLQLCPNPILVETARKVISGLAFKLRVDTIGELVPVEHLLEYYPVFRDAVAAGDPIAAELAIETIHMLDRGTTTGG